MIITERYKLHETIDGAVIDPDFFSEVWHEAGDVVSLNGPSFEWMPDVEIVDQSGRIIFKDMIDEESNSCMIVFDDYPELNPDSSYFSGRTGELIHQAYNFQVDGGFDKSLLKLKFDWYLGIRILTDVTYDNISAEIDTHHAQNYDGPSAGIIINY